MHVHSLRYDESCLVAGRGASHKHGPKAQAGPPLPAPVKPFISEIEAMISTLLLYLYLLDLHDRLAAVKAYLKCWAWRR